MRGIQGEVILPPSSRDAEFIIFCGLLRERGLLLTGAEDVAVSEDVMGFATGIGYCVSRNNGRIECVRAERSPDHADHFVAVSGADFVRKLLAMSRNRINGTLEVPTKIAKELEVELLLLRRMGVGFEMRRNKGMSAFVPNMSRVDSIKYRLQTKHYYLIEALTLGALATGCSIELSSQRDLTLPRSELTAALGVNLSANDATQDDDELSRRLKKLHRTRSVAKEYCLRADQHAEAVETSVPGDSLLGLFLAAAACCQTGSEVIISNVPSTEVALAGFRLLGKLGAVIEIRSVNQGDRSSTACVTVRSGDLIGKKLGGDAIRACPEAFFVLAPLGMLAQEKTVIRDLPFGSALWRKRISLMKHILESCGARIGELEDGLVVETSKDLMYSGVMETSDELCDMTQQLLSILLPCRPSFVPPHQMSDSPLCRTFAGLSAKR
jgi:hypothetical protein